MDIRFFHSYLSLVEVWKTSPMTPERERMMELYNPFQEWVKTMSFNVFRESESFGEIVLLDIIWIRVRKT